MLIDVVTGQPYEAPAEFVLEKLDRFARVVERANKYAKRIERAEVASNEKQIPA